MTVSFSLCLAAEKDVVTQWKFDKSNADWKAEVDCKLSTKDGLLVVESTDSDPHFTANVKAPSGWKKLRMRVDALGTLNGQVFWAEDGKAGFAEERSVQFSIGGKVDSLRAIDVFFRREALNLSV